MRNLRKLKSYLLYLVRGRTKYSIHSPFLFNLVTTVFEDRTLYPEYALAEGIRRGFLRSRDRIERDDAGSGGERSSRVQRMARRHAVRPKYGRLLFRLARKYKPAGILELGTSLGIGTTYLSLGCPDAHLISIEGCRETWLRASANPHLVNNKVKLIHGRFRETLPDAIAVLKKPCLVYIDGDHRKAPSLEYFNLLVPWMDSGSLIVVDDIHHSAEMEEAWQVMIHDPRVRMTIDLFQAGLLFFKKELSPGHFVVRF